jgi:hypothetical protein
MKAIFHTAIVLLSTMAFFLPGRAAAQVRASDSYVARPGQLRLQAGAEYTGYDHRYGTDGSEPLAGPLLQSLTASTYAPLQPLSSGLAAFFAATAGEPGATPVMVDDSTLTLGAPHLSLFESVTRMPISLSLGVLPRVELGVSVPILRGQQTLQRFVLADGTVGANPAADANAALLAGISAEWEALGSGGLLPTAESALGTELQARVRALTGGETLQLPSAAADTALFQQQLVTSFGVPPVRSRVDRPRMGDAEVFARLRLLSTFGEGAVPPREARGAHLRSTLLLGVRLPTGMKPDTVELFAYPYDIGLSGYSAGLLSDLFVGRRVRTTVGASFASYSGADVVRLFAPSATPLATGGPPVGARFTPGSALEVRVAPQLQLVEGIFVGVEYDWARVGASRLESGGVALETAGGSGQRLGFGLRYSTLPAYEEGRTKVPMEIDLRYQRSLAGPEGAPDTGYTTIQVQLLPRLWGR